MQGALSTSERWLRGVLIAHAIWSALLALGYIVDGDTRTLVSLPNSFAKDALFVMISAVAAADVRRFGGLALVIAAGYVALVLGQIATLLWGGAPPMELPLAGDVDATVALFGWMAIDVVLAALFAWLWFRAARDGHGLRFLNPLAFLTLAAVAEVLIEGDREVVAPREVARNVDNYLADLDSTGKGRIQAGLIVLGLWPLLTARPPLFLLAPDTRKTFLKKRFLEEIAQRRVIKPLKPFLQALVRTGSQMSYLGYYGDARSWDEIGYRTYQRRPGGRLPVPEDAIAPPPLEPLEEPPRRRYDAIVVGSGAAGGILAYRLAEAGKKVLVLERGPYVDPQTFGDDEVVQYLRLYNEGALQLATDFGLQVLQGMCVGGGTTINNALCLDPPDLVLEQWASRGLDSAALKTAIAEVRTWFGVEPISEATVTQAAKRFKKAVGELDLPGEFERMHANIAPAVCRGTGYCNIGCAYGRKLSMLETALPWAQRDFPGKVRILAGTEVVRLRAVSGAPEEILDARARLSDGRRVTIRANTFVLAAGTIASSWLLMRSGIGRDLPVGRGVSFNMGSPLTAEFAEPVDAYAGLQISHYAFPIRERGFVLETWWNPPATQAVNLPGWFEDHFENMKNFRKLMGVGVLVGTKSNAHVRRALTGGPGVVYAPEWDDLYSLADGLAQVGEILFAAGAKRVMANTWAYDVFTHPNQLSELYRICDDPSYISLGTGHPQGGNGISRNPDRGVVDPKFRVHGYQNLYVCDASVFPTSVTVNPQLTVMALAHYAAPGIQ